MSSIPNHLPPPVGRPDELAWLRELLRVADYTEEAVCERLEIPSPAMLDPHHYPCYRRCLDGDDAGALLTRLFLLQEAIPAAAARATLGPEALQRLAALGLAALDGDEGVRARVDLYPYRGLWLATDRSDRCGELTGPGLPDAVMALNLSSHALAQVTLPIAPGSRALDLGAGCGLHALLAARAGAVAVGTDLNPRAIAFARFNAALNELEEVSFRTGDLYAPVAGDRFDRILVNPAFILTPESRVLFRDGGARGDAMSRRAIEAAAEHLAPGGIAQVVGEFPTLAGETFEERVASWVDARECDLLLLRFSAVSALEYASLYSQEPFGQSPAEYEQAWRSRWEAFQALELSEVAFGAVLLRRRDAGRPWRAARAASLEQPLGERLERFLATKDRLDDPAFPPPEVRPRMAPGLLLVDGRQWDGSRWHEQEGHVSLPGDPLLPEAVLAAGARDLLLLCDGSRPTGEILADVSAGTEDPDATRIAAHGALRDLIERGLVLV